jgi:hypothetical protein
MSVDKFVTFQIIAWGNLTAPWGWVGHTKAIDLSKPPTQHLRAAGISDTWTITTRRRDRELAEGQIVLAEYRDGFGVNGGIVF